MERLAAPQELPGFMVELPASLEDERSKSVLRILGIVVLSR